MQNAKYSINNITSISRYYRGRFWRFKYLFFKISLLRIVTIAGVTQYCLLFNYYTTTPVGVVNNTQNENAPRKREEKKHISACQTAVRVAFWLFSVIDWLLTSPTAEACTPPYYNYYNKHWFMLITYTALNYTGVNLSTLALNTEMT